MANQSQKPIPKPRKNPPVDLPVVGFIINNENNNNLQHSNEFNDEIKPKISDEILNKNNNLPASIGWTPSITEMNSIMSELSSQSDNHNDNEIIKNDETLQNKNYFEKNELPIPPLSPPPSIPPPILLPEGPPPPIPPRTYKGKPVPFNTNELDLLLEPINNTCEELKLSTPSSTNSVDDGLTATPTSSNNLHFENIDDISSLASDDLPKVPSNDLTNIHYNSSIDSSVLNHLSKPDTFPMAQSICLSGWITYKTKNDMHLWLVLRNNELTFYRDELAENEYMKLALCRLLFVGKSTENASDIIMMLRSSDVDMNFAKKNAELIKFAPEDKFDFWISLLAKSNCPDYSIVHDALQNIEAGGQCYIKNGVTGVWFDSYFIIKDYEVLYLKPKEEKFGVLDLRKTACLEPDLSPGENCNLVQHSACGPVLLIFNGSAIYFQCNKDRCTYIWRDLFKSAYRGPVTRISRCAMTSDDIPIFVDKCINFIAKYGIQEAGLYRKNGVNSQTKMIFNSLINDPRNYCIKMVNDDTIHAVASAMRMFFRQLDNPLITTEIQPELFKIEDEFKGYIKLGVTEGTEQYDQLVKMKIAKYKNILTKLDKINYNTLKRIIDHLYIVKSFQGENRTSVAGLARVFAPTIFTVDGTIEKITKEADNTGHKIGVVADLLDYYQEIFDDSSSQQTIEITKMFLTHSLQKSVSKGFLLPVHLFNQGSRCFNVQSTMTAEEIITNKLKEQNMGKAINEYAIYEVLKGGTLERRLWDNETLHDVALCRWIEWKVEDGFFLLKREISHLDPANTRPFAEDVKISEPGFTKFKSAQLRILNGSKIQQFSKGEKLSKPIKEWQIDEVVWFYGIGDRKHPSTHPYACTFFVTTGKYNIKYPGYCVVFSYENQMTQWLNAVLVNQQFYSRVPLVPDV